MTVGGDPTQQSRGAAAGDGTACWLCGGTVRPHAQLAPHPFVACAVCGFVFRPLADAGAIYTGGAYEDVRGEQYLRSLLARRSDARVRLRFLAAHAAPPGRLLDVGAAGGAFVLEAAAAGWSARGVEPTPAFAAAARSLGADVAEGTLEDVELGVLDAATLWHVLEHIPEPVAQLARLRAALGSRGVVAIEVPNYGGAAAARLGAAWPSLEPEVHVNQFTAASLRAALERAGFASVSTSTVSIGPYLPAWRRLDPRHLAARLADRGGEPELLRAVATP